MRDKYLGKDGLTEKYNFIGSLISCGKNLGMLGGGVCIVGGARYENITSLGIGAGVIALSYFGGNYISKKNKEKKEKALNNIEARLLAEGRK